MPWIFCLLVFSLLPSVAQQEDQESQSSSESEEVLDNSIVMYEEPTVLGELLFSIKGELNTLSEIIENTLFKGVTLYWNAKADTRYAVISTSSNVDTLQRLIINNISVYRDLYLGEDAGVTFTSDKEVPVAITIFSPGKLDGSIKAIDIINSAAKVTSTSTRQDINRTGSGSDNTTNNSMGTNLEPQTTILQDTRINIDKTDIDAANKEKESTYAINGVKIGEYFVEVYELPSNPDLIDLPYTQEGLLSNKNTIARRVSKEYRVNLVRDSRVFFRMISQEFDTLLEISDRYGRTIISDDWGETSSLITFVVPKNDDYFVTASSFDGLRTGNYVIEILSSENELLDEIEGQVTPNSPKILRKYASTHELPIQKGGYMTAEVQALDNTLEIAFVNDALNAIYFDTIPKGQTRVIPLYAETSDKYQLLILSGQKVITNYLMKLYR